MPVLALSLLIAAVLGGGCRDSKKPAAAPAAAPSPSSTVDLPGGARALLFDTITDRGVVVVIEPSDVAVWSSFAQELARAGYRVLLVPLSGSDDAAAARAAADDLAHRGAQRVVFVGSGRGAGPALAAAAAGAAGVAVLNPVADPDPTPASGMPPVPSLEMASLADGAGSAIAQQLYKAAPDPRQLALYPAREPAPAAFAAASDLKSVFLDFLRKAFQPLSAGLR